MQGLIFAFNINKLDGCAPGDKVMEITRGWGADIQVEVAGVGCRNNPGDGKIDGYKRENNLPLAGQQHQPQCISTSLVSGANKIIGARGIPVMAFFHPLLDLLLTGNRLEKMITARYTFNKIMEAIKASSARKDGKILIKIKSHRVTGGGNFTSLCEISRSNFIDRT